MVALPEEVYHIIFRNLCIRDLIVIKSICRDGWKLNNNEFWKEIYNSRFGPSNTISNISWCAQVIQLNREMNKMSVNDILLWTVQRGFTALLSKSLSRFNSLANEISGDLFEEAITHNQEGIIQVLLDRKIRIRCSGYTCPLYQAAFYNQVNIIKLLLPHIDINSRHAGKSTPIYIACQKGNLETLITLHEAGGDIEDGYNEYTPLFVASMKGQLEVVKYLITQGANIDKLSSDQSNPTYVAAQEGHHLIVRELLAHNSNPNPPFLGGYTSTYIAAQNNHHAVLRELCVYPHKFRVNDLSPDGSTPLYAASQNGHLECVKILLDYGADPKIAYSFGYTPLYVAAQKDRLDIVKLLISRGVDVNTRTHKSATPLYVAAQKGYERIVLYLLDQGADIDAQFKNGYTPLHVAIVQGHQDVVRLLIGRGARLDLRCKKGETPMSLAIKTFKIRIIYDMMLITKFY